MRSAHRQPSSLAYPHPPTPSRLPRPPTARPRAQTASQHRRSRTRTRRPLRAFHAPADCPPTRANGESASSLAYPHPPTPSRPTAACHGRAFRGIVSLVARIPAPADPLRAFHAPADCPPTRANGESASSLAYPHPPTPSRLPRARRLPAHARKRRVSIVARIPAPADPLRAFHAPADCPPTRANGESASSLAYPHPPTPSRLPRARRLPAHRHGRSVPRHRQPSSLAYPHPPPLRAFHAPADYPPTRANGESASSLAYRHPPPLSRLPAPADCPPTRANGESASSLAYPHPPTPSRLPRPPTTRPPPLPWTCVPRHRQPSSLAYPHPPTPFAPSTRPPTARPRAQTASQHRRSRTGTRRPLRAFHAPADCPPTAPRHGRAFRGNTRRPFAPSKHPPTTRPRANTATGCRTYEKATEARLAGYNIAETL